MTVSETGLQHRPAMYWFDVRQQFGAPGVLLAAIGFCYVLWRWPRRGALLLLLYAANMAFAWTYNVGDAYIFFLPSHYVVALCAGAGIAAVVVMLSRVSNRSLANAAAAALLLYPAWRGYDTFPAVDRSWDRRAEQLLDEFMSPPHRIQRIRQVWQMPPYTALTRTGKSRTHSSTSCASAGRQFRGSRRMNSSGWSMETSANASKNCSTPICRSAAKCSRLRACTGGFESSDTTEALAMSDFSSRLESSRPVFESHRVDSIGNALCPWILRPDREYAIDEICATLGLVIADRRFNATA